MVDGLGLLNVTFNLIDFANAHPATGRVAELQRHVRHWRQWRQLQPRRE
jgi:hypothetical protein